jgi:hypothetical protein
LNFLSFLPWLEDGTIVVLHDVRPLIAGYHIFTAPILLLATLVAPKLQPKGGGLNIAAFQVTEETRKHIRNVFYGLLFPWGYIPDPRILDSIGKIVTDNYDSECQALYTRAVEWQLSEGPICFSYAKNSQPGQTLRKKDVVHIHQYLNRFKKIIFYGAGRNCSLCLNIFAQNGLPSPHEIWDVNAKAIGRKNAIPVVIPNFASLTPESKTLVIITLLDDKAAAEVMEQLGARNAPFIRLKDLAGDLKQLMGNGDA